VRWRETILYGGSCGLSVTVSALVANGLGVALIRAIRRPRAMSSRAYAAAATNSPPSRAVSDVLKEISQERVDDAARRA
jgi:hypothetical protein